MSEAVRKHYETYPYPSYPLIASVRAQDTYALNLEAIWTRFNGALPFNVQKHILIAGCGSFAPYPFSLANPDAAITALDLSGRTLARAHLHCLLHGRRNIHFLTGDLVDPSIAPGPFANIDAYGVLHHLDDPLEGFMALAARLETGGILRVMVYSRYARREEESIRRAFRLLKVRDATTAQQLIDRSEPGSRLHRFSAASHEVGFVAGLADALLHPRVHTFRIDELMEMVHASGLEPLLFAHKDARENPEEEIGRLRRMEACKESPGNFVLYLGHGTKGPCSLDRESLLILNPCLRSSVGLFRIGAPRLPGRLGSPAPALDRRARAFLRRFIRPVQWDALTPESRKVAAVYINALFLLKYRP